MYIDIVGCTESNDFMWHALQAKECYNKHHLILVFNKHPYCDESLVYFVEHQY